MHLYAFMRVPRVACLVACQSESKIIHIIRIAARDSPNMRNLEKGIASEGEGALKKEINRGSFYRAAFSNGA
jgi:hypothetical protein